MKRNCHERYAEQRLRWLKKYKDDKFRIESNEKIKSRRSEAVRVNYRCIRWYWAKQHSYTQQ